MQSRSLAEQFVCRPKFFFFLLWSRHRNIGRHDCDLPVVSPGAFPVGKVRKAVGLVWWVLCRRCVCGFRVCRGLVVVGCCGLWWLSSFGCASACSCVVVRCGWRLSACRRYEFHRHSFHHRQLLSHSLRTTFEAFAF